MFKRFSAVIFIFLFFSKLFALDLLEVNSKLADAFDSFIDENEGLTTFRSLNIPAGGRVEGLGTAFTGLCDDISFFDYNPAASAVLEYSQAYVSHNAWIADSAMETIAATRRNGKLGYGAQLKCFYVPFTEYNLFGDHLAGNYYTETSATFNIAYNFFSGYDFKGLTVGANARAAWRGMPDYTDNDSDKIIKKSGLEQSGLGIMGDVGILMRFNALKFYSDRNANLTVGISANNLGASFTGFSKSVKADDPLPSRIAAGISYKPIKHLLITTEFRQPLNLKKPSESGKFSFAVGAETYITKYFSFQGGFLLQGGNPRISMGSEFKLKAIRMDVSYTLDLTSSANPVNHISLSAKIDFGDRGRKEALNKVDAAYLEGLEYYSAGSYDEAIIKWNEAIKLAGQAPLYMKYEPAVAARKATVSFNKNKQALQSLQNLSDDE